jgi:hypothetical protein
VRALILVATFTFFPLLSYGNTRTNPFACQDIAREFGAQHSLRDARNEARSRADAAKKAEEDATRHRDQGLNEDADTKMSRAALEYCTAAELYKRLGAAETEAQYESAIKVGADEPAFELFYGDYLRLYRGAGQRPLFPRAEAHLLAALEKLAKLSVKVAWDSETERRLQRSLTALYERDGVHLADRKSGNGQSEVSRPWLFFSPGVRSAWSTDDFDQTSDIRDLTSAALFSQNCLPPPIGRLCSTLSKDELEAMARVETPMEADGTLRIRYDSVPVIDIFGSARRTEDGAINSSMGFFAPDAFSDLKLVDFGFRIEKPFVITGNTDADLQFSYDHVTREGLVEFYPHGRERIGQYQAYGSISHYLGPDRINLSYTYVRQNINPTPYLVQRDRELMGATVNYQLFRPLSLPGRDLNTGLGRYFETRGIDLFTGFLNDHDHYRGSYADVITRRDYFVGVAARGLGRFDVTVQPTWYTSQVSIDPTQYNSQFRMAGNVLYRVVDEERTPGIPSLRFLGMPVAFVQIVVPFHSDVPLSGLKSFESRSVGGELWVKFFTRAKIGTTVLGVIGYSRDAFPLLSKDFNLGRVGLSIGF